MKTKALYSAMMTAIRPPHITRLFLALLTTASILPADASFIERAQIWFSPISMIQRFTVINPSNRLGTAGFLRKSSHQIDDKMKNTPKPYDIGRRALLDIGYSGALYGAATSVSFTFDNAPLWKSISTVCISNIVGCVLSLVTGSHLHLDLLGAGAFGMAALSAIINSPKRAIFRFRLSSSFVILWSFKLASFLFIRILQNKHDARLDELLSTTSGAVSFWFISALWGVICGLPHYLGATSSGLGNNSAICFGSIVYVLGLLIETLADYQKWAFKKSNPRKFCKVGLWSVSQHPNFFGNLLIWIGILIINAPSLIEPTSVVVKSPSTIFIQLWRFRRFGLALLSPLFMWTLFYGQASGSITKSVSLANLKYGDDPNYKKYVASVPLIIPRFYWYKR